MTGVIMAVDKYGTDQDSYCYDGSTVLRNKLNIIDEDEFQKAEQVLTELAALDIELKPPLYDLSYLCGILSTDNIICTPNTEPAMLL